MNSEEYAAVVHEERGGFRFTARYLPPDAMMVNHYRAYEEQCERVIADRSLSELDRTRSLNRLRREVERVRSGYEETWSFQLTIEPLHGRDLVYEFEGAALIGGYESWLQTLMFGLQAHLVLSNKTGTAPPMGYHMDRTFGTVQSRTFLISFARTGELEKFEEGAELVVGEFGLGTGSVTFRFEQLSDTVEYLL